MMAIRCVVRFRVDCTNWDSRARGTERWFVFDSEGEYEAPIDNLKFTSRHAAWCYAYELNYGFPYMGSR